MKRAFRKYFIPHEGNNYKPHFLHTKRTLFYGMTFLLMKVIVVGFTLLLPATAFVMPDVLANEEIKLAGLVNNYRAENNIQPLSGQVKLYGTATDKANDMVTKQYFGHISPVGRTLADIMEEHDYAYQFAGENLALGFADASELIAAWIESPTHRANLLDPDFSEYGISMVAGSFEDEPTVFAVNHFGNPIESVLKLKTESVLPEKIEYETVGGSGVMSSVEVEGDVSSTVTIAPSSSLNILATYDREKSFVLVTRNKTDDVIVRAQVFMGITPKSAKIEFGSHEIPLNYDETTGSLMGVLTLDASESRINVLTAPVLLVVGDGGEILKDDVALRGQVLSTVTPMQKYVIARKTLGDLMPIFKFSREVYLGFIALFAAALALNVFVEIKKQHPHIILQTSGLLIMLLFLWAI